jgi:signal transduction histidine kinase
MSNTGELSLTITSVRKMVDVDKKTEVEYICISLDDTGPGIPPKVLKNLFEPFVKGSEQGVGLGLSISQNIATMHHGWIEGENKPNSEGAVFRVYIPTIQQKRLA